MARLVGGETWNRPLFIWTGSLLVVAAIAAWLDLGSFHDSQNADSLLPVLISTQHWTPFFWGQDRFGMLVPLIASPAHNPITNLLLQGWLSTTAALLAPLVVARALTDDLWACVAIGAVADFWFLVIAAPAVRFDWLVTQPYGLSMALGFGALAVLDSKSVGATMSALILLFLAHWVNLGVFVLLVPVILFRPRRLRAMILLALAVCGGIVLARVTPAPHTTTAVSAPSEWMNGWIQLLKMSLSTVESFERWIPLVAVALLLGPALVQLFAKPAAREQVGKLGAREPVAMAALLLGIAIINWLFVGTSEWVRLNLYFPRYMFPSLMLATIAVSTLEVAAVRLRISRAAIRAREPEKVVGAHGSGEVAGAAAMASLGFLVIVMTPLPSFSRFAQGLDARFGQMSAEVVSSGADVIAGDYWTVWPAVFQANVSTYRAGAGRRVFGLTYRSEPTEGLWRRPGARTLVAASPKDATVQQTAERHDVRLTLLAHEKTIDLFEGIPGANP